MKLLIHYQNSTVQPLKFRNGEVKASPTLQLMQLFIHAWRYYKQGHWWQTAFCVDRLAIMVRVGCKSQNISFQEPLWQYSKLPLSIKCISNQIFDYQMCLYLMISCPFEKLPSDTLFKIMNGKILQKTLCLLIPHHRLGLTGVRSTYLMIWYLNKHRNSM